MGAEGSKVLPADATSGAASRRPAQRGRDVLTSAAAVGALRKKGGGTGIMGPPRLPPPGKRRRKRLKATVTSAKAKREAARAARFDAPLGPAGVAAAKAKAAAAAAGDAAGGRAGTSHGRLAPLSGSLRSVDGAASLASRSPDPPSPPRKKLTKAQAEAARQQLADKAQAWFTTWSVEYVQRSYERVQALGTHRLTRSSFWEVFTFYDAVANGEFLSLPQEAFSVFQDGPDSPDVDAIEVLLALALFSRGSPQAQLRLCFDIFDADGNGAMDVAEMTEFFRVLCRVCTKVGILVAMPSELKLQRSAVDAMAHADLDGGGEIEIEEWVFWARTNVLSKRILNGFNNAAQKGRTASTAKGHAHRTVPLGTSGAGGPDGVGPGGTKLGISSAVQTRVVSANNMYQACTGVIKLLQDKPEFSLANIAVLQREFKARAGTFGTLTRMQFRELMVSRFPELEHGDHMAKLFVAFDENNSGDIDPKEFALGLAKLMVGGIGDKLDLLFAVLDNDGDGDVSIEELTGFVNRTRRDAADISTFAQSLVGALDKDGDGNISKDEFQNALEHQPVLYSTFTGSSVDGLSELKRMLKKKGVKLDFRVVKTAWERKQRQMSRATASGPLAEREMGLAQFRVFMTEEIGVPHSMVTFCNQMFKVVDVDKSGSVSLTELFRVLAQITSTSLAERAQFYFSLYDLDGSGELSREEIHQMLMSSQEDSEDTAVQTTALLNKLDIDGDGSVTQAEFFAAAKKEPALLEMFGKLFGVEDVVAEDANRKPSDAGEAVGELADLVIQRTKGAEDKIDSGSPGMSRAQRRLKRLANQKAMDARLTSQLKQQDAGTVAKVLDSLREKEQTAFAARPQLASLASIIGASKRGGLATAVGGGAGLRGAVRRAASDNVLASAGLAAPRHTGAGDIHGSSIDDVDGVNEIKSVSIAVHAATRAYGSMLMSEMQHERDSLDSQVKEMKISEHERGKHKGFRRGLASFGSLAGMAAASFRSANLRKAREVPHADADAARPLVDVDGADEVGSVFAPYDSFKSVASTSSRATRHSVSTTPIRPVDTGKGRGSPTRGARGDGSSSDSDEDFFKLDDSPVHQSQSPSRAREYDVSSALPLLGASGSARNGPHASPKGRVDRERRGKAEAAFAGRRRPVKSKTLPTVLQQAPFRISDPNLPTRDSMAARALNLTRESRSIRIARPTHPEPARRRWRVSSHEENHSMTARDKKRSLRRAEIAPTYSVGAMREELEVMKRYSQAPTLASLSTHHVALPSAPRAVEPPARHGSSGSDGEADAARGDAGDEDDFWEDDDEGAVEVEGHFGWLTVGGP